VRKSWLTKRYSMINVPFLNARFMAQVKAVGFLGAVGQTGKQIIKQRIRRLNPVQDDFDIRHGTEIGGSVNLWKYKIASPNAKYGAS